MALEKGPRTKIHWRINLCLNLLAGLCLCWATPRLRLVHELEYVGFQGACAWLRNGLRVAHLSLRPDVHSHAACVHLTFVIICEHREVSIWIENSLTLLGELLARCRGAAKLQLHRRIQACHGLMAHGLGTVLHAYNLRLAGILVDETGLYILLQVRRQI